MSNSEKKVVYSFRITSKKLELIKQLASKQEISKRANKANVTKELHRLIDIGLRDSGVDF